MINFTDILHASSDALVHETYPRNTCPSGEGHDAKYVELRTVFVDPDVAYRKSLKPGSSRRYLFSLRSPLCTTEFYNSAHGRFEGVEMSSHRRKVG
jgi:hypothetical protein